MSEGQSAATPQPEIDWTELEIAIRKAKFVREEFPFPCGFPSEIYPQLMAVIRKQLGSVAAPKAQPDTGTPTLNSQIARHEAIEAAPEHKTHTVWRQRVDTWKDLETGAYIAILPERLTQGTTEERAIEAAKSTMKFYAKLTEHEGNWPEAGAPKAGEPQADWLHETDSVKFGLKYIADSPAHEFGGFHPKTFEIAKEALQRIEELERGAGEPPQELVKLVSAVQEFLKHDGGSGSEDYDALKRSEARRSMQSVLGFRCPKCGETLPHLYDENCTDYRVRGAGETPAERWIPVEEKLPPKNRHTSWKNYRCSDVVVAFNGQQTTAEAITNPDGETVWVDGDVTVKNVTHWRPLPLPPGAGSTKEGK